MQKWEYMTWVVGRADTLDADMSRDQGGRVKYLNGQKVDSWENGLRLTDALNYAGNEGWELVDVKYPPAKVLPLDPIYIFKRPKS